MHILFIVPYVPNNIRPRSLNLIKTLSATGHNVTVLTLAGNRSEWDDAEKLREYASRVIVHGLGRGWSLMNSASALVAGAPLQSGYCWQPSLGAALRALLAGEKYDVVHVEHLRGARYGLLAKRKLSEAEVSTPVVWDSVDCISYLFRQAATLSVGRLSRLVARLELPLTERFESRMISVFDRVLVTTPVDREKLAKLTPVPNQSLRKIDVLSLGVDLNQFRPSPALERDPATLILTGKMSYHANVTMGVHLVRDIMPMIWARRPDTRLLIVGKDPTREILALGTDPRVTVTGAVPDLQPYLAKATIAVVPIVYSAGIQSKVMEAMACATPVVTTDQVAAGLNANTGEHLLVCHSADEFADTISRLLNSPEICRKIGLSGREYVGANHSWIAITERLVNLYQKAQEDPAPWLQFSTSISH